MNTSVADEANAKPPSFELVVLELLEQIVRRLTAIEQDFDEIDRTVLRPYGDGTKPRRRYGRRL